MYMKHMYVCAWCNDGRDVRNSHAVPRVPGLCLPHTCLGAIHRYMRNNHAVRCVCGIGSHEGQPFDEVLQYMHGTCRVQPPYAGIQV